MDECFVGRARELGVLDGLLSHAAAGLGQVVAVRGPAGIGKTALIRYFLAARGVRADWASGDQDEIALPGGLLEQLARSGQETTAQLPATGPPGTPATLAPRAAPLIELLGSGETDPLRAGAVLLAMLRRWPGDGPAAVVIDDAQWGDELSLRALSYALRRLRGEPVLGIIAARADDFENLPPGLLRVISDHGQILEISGLGADEVAVLAERAGVGHLPGRAAQRLCQHTGGVPLHVRELLHALPREALCTPETVLPAPRSLEVLVLSRLAGCAMQTQRLVIAAAVLGGRCRLAEAAALADLDDPLPALQEAVRQRLLAELETIDGRCCEFPHATIRVAVYRDIGVSRRTLLHRRAAALCGGPAALGHRVAACPGDDPELAAELEAKALAETGAGQLTEAAGHLLAAVRVGERGSERDRRLVTAVGLLLDAGDAARARVFAAEISALPPSGARSLTLGRLAMLTKDAEGAERWLTDAWAQLAGLDADGAATVACDLAMLLLSRRRTTDAATWARRAAGRAATSVPRACAQVVLGTCLALAGQPDQALARLRAELGRIPDDGDPARMLIRLGIGTVLLWCDDLAGAAGHLGTAAAAGGCRGLPLSHLLEASVLRVLADYRMGEWDEAVAGAARLVALVDDLDQNWLLASAHCCAVYPHAGRGEWELASAHADAAARLVRGGSSDRVLELVNAQAALAFARDDPEGVIAAAAPVAGNLTALAGLEPTLLGFWPLYAHALARTGQLAQAAEVTGPFAELAAARGRRSALAAAHRVRGTLEAARQRPQAAHAAYQSAIACLDGLSMPHEEALTRLDYGRFLRRAGQRRAALRELCAARAAFAGLGAAPFVARCDAELGQDLPAGPLPPLTARQLAVARAVAAGKSNQQVARDLYITVKTVEYHVSQILTRLGVDARTEIAAALPAFHYPERTVAALPAILPLPGAGTP